MYSISKHENRHVAFIATQTILITTQKHSTIRYDFVRYFDSDKTTMHFSIFWNLPHYLSKQKKYEQNSFINNNHYRIHHELLMQGFNNY